MSFGICPLAIIPVRREPEEKSEMVTQLLFGEGFEILESTLKWMKIQTIYDSYIGWVDSKTIQPASYSDIDEEENVFCCSDINAIVKTSSGNQYITLGSTLPYLKNKKGKLGNEEFSFQGVALNSNLLERTDQNIQMMAEKFLNAPYLWGGRTIWGIDCSGFTQIVFKMFGIKLKRDAFQQAEQGILINFVDEARTGDLAFFKNDEGRIVHVGMIVSKNRIIHSSGKVRVDHFDHFGIYNSEKKNYSHQLRFIKRIL